MTPSKCLLEGDSGVSQVTGLLGTVFTNTVLQGRAFKAGFSSLALHTLPDGELTPALISTDWWWWEKKGGGIQLM